MKQVRIIFKLFVWSVLLLGAGNGRAMAQKADTLWFRVLFESGQSGSVNLDYAENRQELEVFENALAGYLKEGAKVNFVKIASSSSPEGGSYINDRLAMERGRVVKDYVCERFGFNRGIVFYESIGEDWTSFEKIVSRSDKPWKDDVLSIVSRCHGGSQKDYYYAKNELKALDGGKVWEELIRDVFPQLRGCRCDAFVVIERKASEEKPEIHGAVSIPVSEPQIQHDTVYIQVPVDRPVPVEKKKERKPYVLDGKRMFFALRTNALAVPLTNVGVMVPLGRRFSVGADWYSPWIWRNDLHKDCFEFQALDIELRYWFRDRKARKEQRMLGFSIGAFAAVGHYDFESDWTGYQGEFWNAGVDFLYAIPLWDGRMHLEFELGIGYIQSLATPYECLEPYGDCYKMMATRRLVRWVGPTRAQVSLVWPIYFKTKGGR